MAYEVDFNNVSTIGLESSPVAKALAGMRANEARYFKNKYNHVLRDQGRVLTALARSKPGRRTG